MAQLKEGEAFYTLAIEYKILRTDKRGERLINRTTMDEYTYVEGGDEEKAQAEIAQNMKEKKLGCGMLRSVADAVDELTDFGITVNGGGLQEDKPQE